MLELYHHALHQILIGFLQGATAQDADLHDTDENSCCWTFTLPELFAITLESYVNNGNDCPAAWRSGYIEFRKLIYSNPTNEILQQMGGIVEIAEAGLEHEQTVFVLRRSNVID